MRPVLWLILWLVLLLCLSTACASKSFTPEPPLPSPERMQELLDGAGLPEKLKLKIAAQKARIEGKFNIRIMPSVLMEGAAMRIWCYVPLNIQSRYLRIGLEGVRVSVEPNPTLETSVLIERVPCGTWTAVCRIANDVRTQDITAKGMCNDGEGDR